MLINYFIYILCKHLEKKISYRNMLRNFSWDTVSVGWKNLSVNVWTWDYLSILMEPSRQALLLLQDIVPVPDVLASLLRNIYGLNLLPSVVFVIYFHKIIPLVPVNTGTDLKHIFLPPCLYILLYKIAASFTLSLLVYTA